MSQLQKALLTASLMFLGLNGCGGTEVQEARTASTRQDVALAPPLPPGCLLESPDTDQDGICDAVEATLGTHPNSSDTDGDRLSDYAEAYGLDGVDLPSLGANPRRKDLFVEVDYYPGLLPAQTTLDRVTSAFTTAPVINPDGSTGVSLHLVVDEEIASADADEDLDPVWTEFDLIKAKYFAASRAPFFHYLLLANEHSGGNISGSSRGIPGHDLVVTLGFAGGATALQLAGTLMHELGHNLGLRHGGDDNATFKPNYLSIMNHEYQFHGFTLGGVANVLDYSRVRVAAFNEAAVNEVAAFTPVAPTTEGDLALIGGLRFNNRLVIGNASANLSFNANLVIEATSYALDFNHNGVKNNVFPASQNDWLALVYDGAGQIGDSQLGALRSPSREQRFLVAPDQMEPCLTVDERRTP
ncbi:matrixin family metalloprotease [Corallococcus terminator]